MDLAENPAYLSDYILGWPHEGKASDGQLDNNGSIGHLINDDFSRDGGSLEAISDPKTEKSYLYLTEDVPTGYEPCFAYGSDIWKSKLRLLPLTVRKACIGIYNFSPTALLALGLNVLGEDTTLPKQRETQPPQERQLATETRKSSGLSRDPGCDSLDRGTPINEEVLRSEDDSCEQTEENVSPVRAQEDPGTLWNVIGGAWEQRTMRGPYVARITPTPPGHWEPTLC